MKAVITTLHVPGGAEEIVWGIWLRKRREMLGLSQEAFASEVACRLRDALQADHTALSALHIRSAKVCTGFEISRFEKGARLPAHRNTHLMFLWALLQLGAVIKVTEANAWLESGAQGWLTAREQKALFAC